MNSITIKLFLASGRSSGIRTAEISNWSGVAVAGPKTELSEFLKRPELEGSGIYFLLGHDPESGDAAVYIGEAETLRKRLLHHKTKEFWVQVVVFTSKDENLSKGHIKYLEGRLINLATDVGRAKLQNSQASGSRLSESDIADMEVFLTRIQQLLPILGSNVLTSPSSKSGTKAQLEKLKCKIKGLTAIGWRTESGFVVVKGSQAVSDDRPSARDWSKQQRVQLLDRGVLERRSNHLLFLKDYEFSSPSAAAGIIRGGNSNGLTCWKHEKTGTPLKDLEADCK